MLERVAGVKSFADCPLNRTPLSKIVRDPTGYEKTGIDKVGEKTQNRTSSIFFLYVFGVLQVLTEQQIQTSFRNLFQGQEITSDLLNKAEELIDQLRLESPLRHRLSEELEELRVLCPAEN